MIARRALFITGTALAVALAAVVAPFASSAPDGLERVATDLHVTANPEATWTHAPLPDYQTPGVAQTHWSTGIAGVIGTLTVLGLSLAMARLLARKHPAK